MEEHCDEELVDKESGHANDDMSLLLKTMQPTENDLESQHNNAPPAKKIDASKTYLINDENPPSASEESTEIAAGDEDTSPPHQSNVEPWEEKISLLVQEAIAERDGRMADMESRLVDKLESQKMSILHEVVDVSDGRALVGRTADLEGRTDDLQESMDERDGRIADLESRLGNVEVVLEGEPLLPPDSFSLLVTTPSCCRSRAHFFAAMVLFLQLVTLLLVYADAVSWGWTEYDENGVEQNYFGFPVEVEPAVLIAEYVAIFIAVFTQDDLVQAFHQFNEGYDEEAFQKSFGDIASKRKWMIQVFLRFVEGAFGLFVTFIIIMRADAVIDLLLNFTALEFVAKLDDVAFKLFELGFFGRRVQLEAKKVAEAKRGRGDGGETDHCCRRLLRPVSLGIVYVIFTASAVYISVQQVQFTMSNK